MQIANAVSSRASWRKGRVKTKPISAVIPVEVLSAEIEMRPRPPEFKRQQSELRKRTLDAVRRHGGHAGGEVMSARERLRRFVMSIKWQFFLLITALIDVCMLIVESSEGETSAINWITAIVLTIFCIDLGLRAYAYRKLLLRSPWAWFDFIVVGASVILYFVGLAQPEDLSVNVTYVAATGTSEAGGATSAARGGRAVRGLVTALRAMRASRFAAKMLQFSTSAKTGARHLTGENKKRFVDLEANFDLDLAYVLPTLIAMSVPATGRHALYRNPLREVIRFFEERHGPEGYLIVNCCPELPYDTSGFASGEVIRFDIQDHTPPTMQQFVDFLNSVKDKPLERMLAVHCRGGKGRTGSICCAWLLYSKVCADADDALTLFALERTDLSQGRKKIQGVDTPSQRRYVHQLDALLRAQNAYLEGGVDKGFVPAESFDGPRPGCVFKSGAFGLGYYTERPPQLATIRSGSEYDEENGNGGGPAQPAAAMADEDEESSPPVLNIPGLVRPPARPAISLSTLSLSNNWYAKPPKGPLCCAVHIDRKVVHWSSAVSVPSLPVGGSEVVFELGSFEVRGDVRVSVFDLDDLLAERKKRLKKKMSPRLPWDGAPSGPWAEDGNNQTAGGDEEQQEGGKKEKRVIAGKEVGCKFFMLFHTGFLSSEGKLPVPLPMMDKAFKNKKGKYNGAGVATLHFEFAEEEAPSGAEAVGINVQSFLVGEESLKEGE